MVALPSLYLRQSVRQPRTGARRSVTSLQISETTSATSAAAITCFQSGLTAATVCPMFSPPQFWAQENQETNLARSLGQASGRNERFRPVFKFCIQCEFVSGKHLPRSRSKTLSNLSRDGKVEAGTCPLSSSKFRTNPFCEVLLATPRVSTEGLRPRRLESTRPTSAHYTFPTCRFLSLIHI